jgi:hypothetical protein
MNLYCHPVVHSLCSTNLGLHDFLMPYLSTGFCICPFDVYVYMHILFTLSDCDVNVLFSDSMTNKFYQLAYELFLTLYCYMFLVPNLFSWFYVVHQMLFFRMVAGYGPLISCNFLILIRLGGTVKPTFWGGNTLIVSPCYLCCVLLFCEGK